MRNYLRTINRASFATVFAGLVLVAAPVAADGTLTPVPPTLTTTTCDVTVSTTNPDGSGWKIISKVDGVVVANPASFVASTGSHWSVVERAIDKTQSFASGKQSKSYSGLAPDAPYCHDNPPVAKSGTVTGTINSPATVSLGGRVSDPDSGDTAKVTSVSNPVHLTVRLINNGKAASYVPETDFVGTASFDYTATDSFGKTATATITVNVVQPTKR